MSVCLRMLIMLEFENTHITGQETAFDTECGVDRAEIIRDAALNNIIFIVLCSRVVICAFAFTCIAIVYVPEYANVPARILSYVFFIVLPLIYLSFLTLIRIILQ